MTHKTKHTRCSKIKTYYRDIEHLRRRLLAKRSSGGFNVVSVGLLYECLKGSE